MKIIKGLVVLLVFALCIALIVIGQMKSGWGWLGIMLLGLAGLLTLLFFYNRRYTRGDKKPRS